MDTLTTDIKKVSKTRTAIMLNEIRDRLEKIAPKAQMTTLVIDTPFVLK